ncbi:DUF1150 family protein [Paracoccus seriniphilus]|uniref:DUF1150 family protein n=1 Tax=Paracoccus seriniphilus TaxID=184748 RepID=A0A239PNI5_9RHOB|nr:DUF1150 family protein [Paracoccus seriniphilus]WCR14883.1 DUF1150 family protein [Paracoccus seriniphilus]SNT71698.1 hypothetical protein SAMN05444959_102212 [Paracoccus seriniphilus]
MDTKFDFGEPETANTVYIRRVATSSLPKEIREQLRGLDSMYAVHDSAGEQLALVRDRSLAFILARQNELTPVSVH